VDETKIMETEKVSMVTEKGYWSWQWGLWLLLEAAKLQPFRPNCVKALEDGSDQ
jgi:hypothetical protein